MKTKKKSPFAQYRDGLNSAQQHIAIMMIRAAQNAAFVQALADLSGSAIYSVRHTLANIKLGNISVARLPESNCLVVLEIARKDNRIGRPHREYLYIPSASLESYAAFSEWLVRHTAAMVKENASALVKDELRSRLHARRIKGLRKDRAAYVLKAADAAEKKKGGAA